MASGCGRGSPPDSGVTEVVLDAQTSLGEPAVLPLLEDDLPVVEAEIAGCGRARMLIDTAMEMTLLDRAFAERCGLSQRPFAIEFLVDTAGGRLQRLERVAHVERITLGSAGASGIDAPLAELSALPFQLDGILGADVLGDWALLFMSTRRELVILPSDGLTFAVRASQPPFAIRLGNAPRMLPW